MRSLKIPHLILAFLFTFIAAFLQQTVLWNISSSHLIFKDCVYLRELLSKADVNCSERNIFKHLFSVSGTSQTIRVAALSAVILPLPIQNTYCQIQLYVVKNKSQTANILL